MKKSAFKRWMITVLLLLVILTLSSCGNSIVGSWTNTTYGLETTMNFNSDGTLSISALGMSIDAGTYKVSGNQLTLSSIEGLPGIGLSAGSSTFSISGDELTIGGVVFTKQK